MSSISRPMRAGVSTRRGDGDALDAGRGQGFGLAHLGATKP
ncbi:MAG: hypothetical protein QGG75_06400 [Alphaproteobacteria bacterium]|nr:hypothetical protein [Alphaproteobacteria bacterium]